MREIMVDFEYMKVQLEQLSADLLELILLQIARVDRRLALWLCHTYKGLRLRVEQDIYESIILDEDKDTNGMCYDSLMSVFQNRPASFFTQHVKSLNIIWDMYELYPLPVVALAVDVCQSLKHISLPRKFPYIPHVRYINDDIDTYFNGLLSNKPESLQIDIDRHKVRYFHRYDINASLPFFSQLVQLDLMCRSTKSEFLTPDLKCMTRLQRIRVTIYEPKYDVLWWYAPTTFSHTLMSFLPSSQLEYCILYIGGRRPPIESWLYNIYGHPLVDGSLYTKLLFGMDVVDERDERYVQVHHELLQDLCWMGPSLPQELTVWDRARKIMKRREGSPKCKQE